jgi:hypothetical protein
MRRAKSAVVLLVPAIALLAGCGTPNGTTPAACLQGASGYVAALRSAPHAVTLSGEVPISGCLPENQNAGDLASVGSAMVTAAVRLNAIARTNPGGRENVELGYLVGAAQRGADSTEGIHSELLRRLAAAARYSPDNRPLSARFLHAYREGFDAGHSNG